MMSLTPVADAETILVVCGAEISNIPHSSVIVLLPMLFPDGSNNVMLAFGSGS